MENPVRIFRRWAGCVCLAAVCICTVVSEQNDACLDPRPGGYWCPLGAQPPVDAPSGDHGPGSGGGYTLTQSVGATGPVGPQR